MCLHISISHFISSIPSFAGRRSAYPVSSNMIFLWCPRMNLQSVVTKSLRRAVSILYHYLIVLMIYPGFLTVFAPRVASGQPPRAYSRNPPRVATGGSPGVPTANLPQVPSGSPADGISLQKPSGSYFWDSSRSYS